MSASSPPILPYAAPEPPPKVSHRQAAFLFAIVVAAALINLWAFHAAQDRIIGLLFWFDLLVGICVPVIMRTMKGPAFHWLLASLFVAAMGGLAFLTLYVMAEIGASC